MTQEKETDGAKKTNNNLPFRFP